MEKKSIKNPIMPNIGLCDPHIRVFDGIAYLYASHDTAPENQGFCMEDWWIWSSRDLVDWKHECTIFPQDTYYGKRDYSCWAVDAISRNGKYYFYFSRGPREIGVLEGDSPIGPWRDVLGKPLIAEGELDTKARDPGVFIDEDGEAYIVFGTWSFYIAKLNEDMVSLAESPKLLDIINPEGPYGKGKTDDKPYLHKYNGKYYLSWGCFYSTSENPYGPYDCHGSIIFEENVDPELRYKDKDITYDRHGSFFEWKNKWYFICNEMGITQNTFFRDSSISSVSYDQDGRIEPINIVKSLVIE